MTENKPVAWVWERELGAPGSNAWEWRVALDEPGERPWHRNAEPLYRRPPAPQPDQDPAVDAARRKALRAIFADLDKHAEASDWTPVTLERAVLRDLVGQPRKNPEQSVKGYDPEPLTGEFLHEFFKAATSIYEKQAPADTLKTSATMTEQRVSTNSINGPAGTPAEIYVAGATIPHGLHYGLRPLGVVTQAPPARLSVGMLESTIANVAHPGEKSALTHRIAKRVHEVIYGKDA